MQKEEGTIRKLDSRGKDSTSTFLQKILRRPEPATRPKLSKHFDLLSLVFLGIANIIGSGVYSMLGKAVAKAGPAFVLTVIGMGGMCYFMGMPTAELASRFPNSSSSSYYVAVSWGELIGYVAGFLTLSAYIVISGICARSIAACLTSLLSLCGLSLPQWLYEWNLFNINLNILAAAIVISMALLCLSGAIDFTIINKLISSLNLLALLLAIVLGCFYANTIQYNKNYQQIGLKGGLRCLGLAYYAYLGFDGFMVYTEETREPQRNVHRALIIVLVVATVIFIGLSTVIAGMAPLDVINTDNYLAVVFKYCHVNWGFALFTFGSITATTAMLQICFLCCPRMILSMSSTGLLPSYLGHINPQTQVIDRATVYVCCVSAILALTFNLDTLGNFVALALILSSGLVDLSLLIIRYSSASEHSCAIHMSCILFALIGILMGAIIQCNLSLFYLLPLCLGAFLIYLYIQGQHQTLPSNGDLFLCPGVPLVPLLGAGACFLIAGSIPFAIWLSLYAVIGWVGISYFLYAFWQPHHSLSFESRDAQLIDNPSTQCDAVFTNAS